MLSDVFCSVVIAIIDVFMYLLVCIGYNTTEVIVVFCSV